MYIDENDKNNEAKALFDSGSDASRYSHTKGSANLIRHYIDTKQGFFGESSVSKHEDLRAVEVSNLGSVVGPALAERINKQIRTDEAKLRSGDYLLPYVKGTQASNDRKKKAPAVKKEAVQFVCPHCSASYKRGCGLGNHLRFCSQKSAPPATATIEKFPC